MSTPTSGLESGDDPENVPLIRLAEVQPQSSACSAITDARSLTSFEYIESGGTAFEDSQSGDAAGSEGTDDDDDESDSGEMNVPEFEPDELPIDIPTQDLPEPKANQLGSWPTLEILPGGVIKRAEKDDEDPIMATEETDPMNDSGELMYACAKCPERFNLLFALVKHVRWHEDERKRQLGVVQLAKMNLVEKELIEIKRTRFDVERDYKQQKAQIMSRIASAVGSLGDLKDIFD